MMTMATMMAADDEDNKVDGNSATGDSAATMTMAMMTTTMTMAKA